MPDASPNKRSAAQRWTTAVLAAFVTWATLSRLPYFPALWVWLSPLAIAGITWAKPAAGISTMIGLCFISVMRISATLGIAFVPFVGLGLMIGAPFLEICALVAAGILTPIAAPLALAVPLVSGHHGTRKGAMLAAAGCVVLETAGRIPDLIGRFPLVRLVPPDPRFVLPARTAGNPLALGWLANEIAVVNPLGALRQALHPIWGNRLLLIQILLWMCIAVVVGSVGAPQRLTGKRTVWSALMVGTITLVLGHGVFLHFMADIPPSMPSVLFHGLIAAAIAGGILFLRETFMPPAKHTDLLRDEELGAPATAPGRRNIPSDTWDELAGIDDIKTELTRAASSQFDPAIQETRASFGLQPTRGVLLFGPPGTGKTKLAHCIAGQFGASLVTVKGGEFASKWFGESEANLRDTFQQAIAQRPSVLFFDELEGVLPKRTDFAHADSPQRGIVSAFLALADDLANTTGILLVAATNHPELIDPAALRPGRFDRAVYVGPPDAEGRAQVLRRYLHDRPVNSDVDVSQLARSLERYTGADLQAVCMTALNAALRRNPDGADQVTMADLTTAGSAIRASVTLDMVRAYRQLDERFSRRSEKTLPPEPVDKAKLTWDDVAGLEKAKDALREAVEMPFSHAKLISEYGVQPVKGVLLFGPPGCGKTFLAKVTAAQTNAFFLHVRGPELLSSLVGDSESQLRDVFTQARENAPSLLFFDEIDALTEARGSRAEVGPKMVAQLLTEMDGVDGLKNVVIMAATNRIEALDNALMRPGRFDRVIYVPLPDLHARFALFEGELRRRPIAEDVKVARLAQITEGFSGSDVSAACNAAAIRAVKEALQRGEKRPISMDILEQEIARTPRSVSPDQLAIYEALREQYER